VLNGLVRTALDQNKDLLIATARIEEFFGRYLRRAGISFRRLAAMLMRFASA